MPAGPAPAPYLRRIPGLLFAALIALALPAAAGAGGPAGAGAAGEAAAERSAGLAIQGYDPVTYFTDGGPLLGSEDFEYEWNGATWRFRSAANRALFAAKPEKYAPQYGGYSAFAVSSGRLVEADPTVFSIVGEKLYLNGSREARAQWLRALGSYISTANGRWPELESSLAK